MAKINRSLYAPNLLWGVERKYAVIMMVVLLIVVFFGDWWTRAIGFIFLAIIWSLLAYANRVDYIFFKVLYRHLYQPKFYLAQAKLFRFYRKTIFKP